MVEETWEKNCRYTETGWPFRVEKIKMLEKLENELFQNFAGKAGFFRLNSNQRHY